ncbi:uncharacterized protein M6B38_287265 [Iris pallida]|uniref:WRKY19-like zinc finger domain-containing protein n=1 Tax=Iris pallida TaxID=29817 RepID=A0AAX6HX69_IRIPA|nr:uncharacterized protein M6B38_287265 [Iris pallida]
MLWSLRAMFNRGMNSAQTTLRLESPGTSIVYDSNSKVTKRKLFDIGETVDHKIASQPLVLGNSLSSLGSSKRSSTTMCTKFPPKVCSMGLKPNFQIHRGGDDMARSKNPSVTAPKEIRTGIDLNLHLSLPDELSESATTGITTASQYECISEKAVAISQRPTGGDLNLHLSLPDELSESAAAGITTASQYECISEKAVAISQGPTAGDASKSAFWIYGSSSSSYLTTLEIPPKAKPIESPDLSSSKTEALSKPVTCTSVMVVQRQKCNNSTKNCEVPGCVKGARGASGLCIAHGGGWRCKKDGCHKGAEGKTIYCKAQGGGRQCQQLGCPERRTDLCIAHGGGRRCTYEGCKRGARGTSDFCIKHGGGKRCQTENCTRSAEGKFGHCISHGGGRRCLYPACTKGAQGRTMLCKAHGGGKRCTFPECTKGAEGSTPFCKGHGGGKRCTFEGGCSKSVHSGTAFCVAHGGGKRCAVADCTKSARGRYDCCVRHGGGRRCKSLGCDKGAQGSTDFCKAHGGGRKPAPRKLGSGFGLGQPPPPHQLAKGKIGLCGAYDPQVQDQRIHGGATLGPLANRQFQTPVSSKSKMEGIVDEDLLSGRKKNFQSSMLTFRPELHSIPESRVHGGKLMEMLAFSSAGLSTDSGEPSCRWQFRGENNV